MNALSPQSLYGGAQPGSLAALAAGNPSLQGITPEMLELLQYLMMMTGGMQGGAGGGGYVPQGSPGFGGGGGGAAGLQNCFDGFLGGGNGGSFSGGSGGYSGGVSGSGSYSGNSGYSGFSGNGNSGSYVSGGKDSYVPGGYTANDRGGAIGHSGQGAEAVAWAESQLGVSEARNPGTVRGYSNGNWQAWCADFVSKSFEKTGGSPFGHQSSVAGPVCQDSLRQILSRN